MSQQLVLERARVSEGREHKKASKVYKVLIWVARERECGEIRERDTLRDGCG